VFLAPELSCRPAFRRTGRRGRTELPSPLASGSSLLSSFRSYTTNRLLHSYTVLVRTTRKMVRQHHQEWWACRTMAPHTSHKTLTGVAGYKTR